MLFPAGEINDGLRMKVCGTLSHAGKWANFERGLEMKGVETGRLFFQLFASLPRSTMIDALGSW
jgi:hypothetical protein